MKAFLFLCLVVSIYGQDNKIYSTFFGGVDAISPVWQLGGAMSYCGNLQTLKPGTLWFTCDEGMPNIRSGGYLPVAGDKSFWLDKFGPPGIPTASPFVSMAVADTADSVSGSAFPKDGTYQGLVLQTLTLTKNGSWTVDSSYIEGFEVFGIIYAGKTFQKTEVFVAGWLNRDTPNGEFGGFVVARGKIEDGHTNIYIAEEDISQPVFRQGCFDIFSTQLKPTLHLVPGYLIVLVPGRCQTFARFTRPTAGQPFSQIQPDVLTPGTFGENYVASSAFDTVSGNFFYALREYNQPDAILYYVVSANKNLTQYSYKLGSGESSISLVAGTEGQNQYVYVVAPQFSPNSGKIDRIQVTGTKLVASGYANLPAGSFKKASSFLHLSPFIYFVTNEPTGALARLNTANFCPNYCGDFAWCDNTLGTGGTCTCLTGYDPSSTGQLGCEPHVVHQEVIRERQVVGTAAVLGVLWVLTTIVAFFGWRASYNQNNSPQAQHLVQEYNRPL